MDDFFCSIYIYLFLKKDIAKLSPSSSLAKPNWGLSLVLILLPPAPTTQTSSENGQYKV